MANFWSVEYIFNASHNSLGISLLHVTENSLLLIIASCPYGYLRTNWVPPTCHVNRLSISHSRTQTRDMKIRFSRHRKPHGAYRLISFKDLNNHMGDPSLEQMAGLSTHLFIMFAASIQIREVNQTIYK